VIPEIAGYDITDRIGAGAMGKVYRATEVATGRAVALKVIAPALLQHDEILRRFAREAHVQSLIDHSSVVRIYHAELEGPTPYLAMEFISGRDLEAVIRSEAPLPLARVARWMTDLGYGLDHLHAQGAVHRDLKPANLMVRDDDSAVVMDLGLAALDQATRITRTGKLIGTPLFLPPEILDGIPSTPRSDQWQMGAVLFECLTGIRLVPGETLQEIGAALMTGQYHAIPTDLEDRIPLHVRETIYRAVSRDPALRFPSISAMARSLETEEDEDRPRTREIAAQVIAEATEANVTKPVAPAQGLSNRRPEAPADAPPRRGLWLGLALGLMAVGALLPQGAANAPRDIEWTTVGDVIRVRFSGGGPSVEAAVEGGELVEAVELEGDRREIRLRGPAPGSQPTVRLRWKGGESLPSTIRVGAPALSPSPSFGPPGHLVFPTLREVTWTDLGQGELRAAPESALEVPVAERDRVELAWEEEGVAFRFSKPTRMLVGRAVEDLQEAIGTVELRAAGLREQKVDPAALRRAREALRAARGWIPDVLSGRGAPGQDRWLWKVLQEYAWGLASETGRGAAADEALSLRPGRPGTRTFLAASIPTGPRMAPDLFSRYADGREVPGTKDKIAPRFTSQVDVFTQERYRDYAVAVRFRWPEGLPRDGTLWFGVDPGRLASTSQIQIRAEDPATSPFEIRLWGTTVGGAMSRALHRDPIGIFLPAALAPAPGTPCLVEVLPLVESIAKSCRLRGLWITAVAPEVRPD
jgi:serine/threonine-protein kinase